MKKKDREKVEKRELEKMSGKSVEQKKERLSIKDSP
jgi:hypothetical protein